MLSWRWLGGVTLIAAVAVAIGWRYLLPSEHVVGAVNLGTLGRGIDRDALNLVVVTLDTTRADRIGSYGGTKAAQTPTFDRLAREGTLFEHAMTTAPLTLPAHASMFTGQFPPAHGVRDNGGFFLSAEAMTLAEHVRGLGMRTGAFVGAFVLDSKWGLDQGFEHYADDFDMSRARAMALAVQRPANEVVNLALPWLEKVKAERFFAWLHFYDPHAPYEPPEPFASQYAGRLYDGEVAFADAQLGRVVEFLESRGLLERTIIAVLADHGESLGEHGEGTHGFFIYEGTARTPFVIRAPFARTKGRRVADLVRTVDLTPTLLDLLGLPPLTSKVSGRSLVPAITGDRLELELDGYAEAMYPLHHYGWSALRTLRAGRFKLIDAPRPELTTSSRTRPKRRISFRIGWRSASACKPSCRRWRLSCRRRRQPTHHRRMWIQRSGSGWPRWATSGRSWPRPRVPTQPGRIPRTKSISST